MNYLAHALLAEPGPHSLIGNIAGDLVKGAIDSHGLHPRVADGLRRHRRVDVLTDRHPDYLRLRATFPSQQRRYAGIVLDVLFDHFLTANWLCFTSVGRVSFIDSVYRALQEHPELLPPPLARVAPRWVDADWLRVYETLDGVDAVLNRVAQRLRRGSPLRGAMRHVEDHYTELEAGFMRVFPDVAGALKDTPPGG